VRLEVGPEYVRVKIGILVLFYSTHVHCIGWWVNKVYHCCLRIMCGTFHSGMNDD
jgi:hypothetical protein